MLEVLPQRGGRYSILDKKANKGSRQPGPESQLCHSKTVQPGPSDLTVLWFNFLIRKMDVTGLPCYLMIPFLKSSCKMHSRVTSTRRWSIALAVTINSLKRFCEMDQLEKLETRLKQRVFPGGAVVKNLPANAGGTGLSPGPGRSHMPRSN